jgi:HK97 family phage major capsid protein
LETNALISEVRTELAGLRADNAKLADEIKTLKETPANGGRNFSLGGAPSIRKGEDPLSSRGYSFLKAVGVASKQVNERDATVEVDVHNRLQKALVQETGFQKAGTNSFLIPFATEHICLKEHASLLSEVRDMIGAGVEGYDVDEVRALDRKFGRTKALSWLDGSNGGAFVPPPVMGELIELFRNNLALSAAGMREISLPPQGRMVWPRQTDAVSAYWVGENEAVTASEFTAGDMVLSPKKLGCLVKLPNELFRWPSVSIEMFVRKDIGVSMALKFDKTGLEGVGSTNAPKGLINYSGITSHTASTVGTDGNTFEPEDAANMIAKCEEQNADFKAWIGRPLMYSKLRNRRADAITAGDKKGPFLFDVWRSAEDDMNRGRGEGRLEGYKFVKSTNVSNTRTKGSGVDLTYILGGNFEDVVAAFSGVIEFLVSNAGDTMVANDQTWVRGINYCDLGLRHEASLVLCDQLVVA